MLDERQIASFEAAHRGAARRGLRLLSAGPTRHGSSGGADGRHARQFGRALDGLKYNRLVPATRADADGGGAADDDGEGWRRRGAANLRGAGAPTSGVMHWIVTRLTPLMVATDGHGKRRMVEVAAWSWWRRATAGHQRRGGRLTRPNPRRRA